MSSSVSTFTLSSNCLLILSISKFQIIFCLVFYIAKNISDYWNLLRQSKFLITSIKYPVLMNSEEVNMQSGEYDPE